MRPLPLVPDGCTLSPDGLAAQVDRAVRLAPAVAEVARGDGSLRVSFAGDVDLGVVEELVETERDCCSFLAIGWDDDARLLRVESSDPRGREVVEQLGALFAEVAR